MALPANQPIRLSAWEMMQKHKPANNSLSGGLLLYMASGIHIGWILYEVFTASRIHEVPIVDLLPWLHFGAIIGGLIGAGLQTRAPKRIIYYTCALLLAIGNAIFIVTHAVPLGVWTAWTLQLVARLLFGLSHGIVGLTLITHAGENSIAAMRGRNAATIGLIQTAALACFQMLALTAYYNTQLPELNASLIVGCVSLVISLLGAAFTAFFTYESLVYMLQTGRSDAEVHEVMCRLRNESTATCSIQNDTAELRAQLEMEAQTRSGCCSNGNARPLLLVCCLRAISVLSNNLLFTSVQVTMVLDVAQQLSDINAFWAAIVLVRLLACAVLSLCADTVGRRTLVITAAGGGLVLLALAIFLQVAVVYYLEVLQAVIVALLALMNLLFGIGADLGPPIVAAEAFALRKKPWSLATATAVEHSLQAVAVICLAAGVGQTGLEVRVVMYLTAVMMVLLGGGVYAGMPETRAMSLAQCRYEYAKGDASVVRYTRETVQPELGITYVEGVRKD